MGRGRSSSIAWQLSEAPNHPIFHESGLELGNFRDELSWFGIESQRHLTEGEAGDGREVRGEPSHLGSCTYASLGSEVGSWSLVSTGISVMSALVASSS